MTAAGRFRRSEFIVGLLAGTFARGCVALALVSCASTGGGAATAPAAGRASASLEGRLVPEAQRARVMLSTEKAADGSLVIARVTMPAGMEALIPRGEYEGVKFPFYPAGQPGAFEALFAIPFNRKPGVTSVRVSYSSGAAPQAGETSFTVEAPLEVIDGNYRSETLSVSERHVNPRKSDLARIKRDQAEVGRIYSSVTEEKRWSGPFVLPIESAVTSPFGTKRVFNGEMKSFHGGLDLRAQVGTPIYAPAGGEVVLSKDLFFTGKTVMIDHGYGLVTIYAHMSKLKVKVGQKVRSRQLLGLSGKTGRVSGPHLHWQAVLHKQKVNPIDLTKLSQ